MRDTVLSTQRLLAEFRFLTMRKTDVGLNLGSD